MMVTETEDVVERKMKIEIDVPTEGKRKKALVGCEGGDTRLSE